MPYFKGLFVKHIISLAGDIGSGKGTIGKLLASSTGYNFISTGNILREIAGKLDMSIVELNKYAETHKEIDEEADGRLVDIEANGDDLIIDSRLAWHFIPSSFKVYLSAFYQTAAIRIYGDNARKAENAESIDSFLAQIKERRNLEILRFNTLYGVKCDDYSNYDLVIQTDFVSPAAILDVILKNYGLWIKGKYKRRIYLSPTSLFPTESVQKLSREDAEFICQSVKEKGFNELEPIEIVKKGDFYYLWDGHKRSSAAIFNNIALIPAILIADEYSSSIVGGITVEQFVSTSYNKSLVYDWEDCHKFRFKEYPFLN